MAESEQFDRDLVAELLPADEIPPTDEEELADFEDDDFFDSEALVVEEDEPQPIGRSWAFDFVHRRFFPAPGGGPQSTHGLATLRYWIEKCLRTERGTYPIYDTDYGIEGVDELIGTAPTEDELADLGGKVHDALLFHPNITDVVGFQATWDDADETVFVSFRVVTDQGDEVDFDDLTLAEA